GPLDDEGGPAIIAHRRLKRLCSHPAPPEASKAYVMTVEPTKPVWHLGQYTHVGRCLTRAAGWAGRGPVVLSRDGRHRTCAAATRSVRRRRRRWLSDPHHRRA